MRKQHRLSHLVPLAAVLTLSLSSCSLPPKQAWQAIRRDGLLTYIRSEVNGTAVPANKSESILASKTEPSAPRTSATPQPAPTNVPPPSQLASDSLPTAQSVPGLAGYVRTPFTNPPRLVDVRGMTPGSKVVCPFTRKPFIVPSAGGEAQVASAPVGNSSPAPAPVTAPQMTAPVSSPAPKIGPAPRSGQVAANNQSNSLTPPPSAPSNAAPAPMPAAAAQDMPFGLAIPGRPGFVNSPFAAKHQLVDVTGLPAGMEVKCPYTGKLFRVPAGGNGQ